MSKVPAPANICLRISTRAAQICTEKMKGFGWSEKSIQAITPLAQEGRAGIRTTQKYIMHQEKGIRPFLMTWVQDRAQPLDAKILTPSGWKLMGDLSVGDEIVDPMGEQSVVEGIFPQGIKEIYRVTLADGSSTEATEDHLWSVEIQGMRKFHYTWTTDKIRRFIEREKAHAVPWNNPVRVPAPVPVAYQAADPLPMAPYTLGALIGDGSMGKRVFMHSVDKEILYRIEQELPIDMEMIHAKDLTYRLIRKRGTPKRNPYISILTDLGLMGHTCYNKYIPDRYKYASVEDRVALLQGLFDTDGCCDNRGCITFVTTSLRLVNDVREVIQSLGGRCSLSTRPSPKFSGSGDTGQIQYRLQNVNVPMNIFYLTRKAERFVPRDGKKFRRIVNVSPTGEKKAVQCIRVSAASRLYVTDDFIPTHNTLPMACKQDGPHFRRGSHVGEPGYVDIPHVGRVWREQRWRHPGLQPKNFMRDSLHQAIQEFRPEIRKQMMDSILGKKKMS